MNYEFKYSTTTKDLWQLSMYYMYGSLVGICNLIFTIAILVLTIAYWGEVGIFIKIFLIFGCILFPVVQPIGIYIRSRKQANNIIENVELSFQDEWIHVKVKEENKVISWKNIRKISKKPNMLIIFTNTTHGFVLNNQVLGKKKDEFYQYVLAQITK